MNKVIHGASSAHVHVNQPETAEDVVQEAVADETNKSVTKINWEIEDGKQSSD